MNKVFYYKSYKAYLFITTLFTLISFSAFTKSNHLADNNPNAFPLEGRWDITIDMPGKKAPSWLEVTHSGSRTLVGQFTGISGSARPISVITFSKGKFSFSIPPQWDREDSDLVVNGTLAGDSLSGTMKFSNGKTYNYTAEKAPSLKRKSLPEWGKPMQIFNGKDLSGWHAMANNQWIVDSGILKSPHSGANLVTDNTYTDFKLHIEFRYPKESNSGVYLRGRYEVQIEDTGGEEPVKNELGSVYGFIAPTDLVAKGAGQWQTFDITLVGRMVTVVANGITIICNQEIPGITGGAINSYEGEPGPILIQGDHGPIDYRNILLTPAIN